MIRVAYVCRPNGWSLHNVGRSLVAPMATAGVAVEIVDTDAWHARPTPADVVLMAHTVFHRPGFRYRDHAPVLAAVVHDPDEVSTFYDRLDWAREPLHHAPEFALYDRIATCSQEMAGVLRERYGLPVWRAATFPHSAASVVAAGAEARAAEPARVPGAPVRFASMAYGPVRTPWPAVLLRLAAPRFWTTDERGRVDLRQARSALVRMHRKNVPWIARLGRALDRDPRAAVDFRFGRRLEQMGEAGYTARLAAADSYVCLSTMEGGPLPVMEAVLAGLAVVTTPVGQTAEWVRDGENGRVVRTYAEALAAVRLYLDRPEMLAAHRARSREIAGGKRFDTAGWLAFFRGERPG